MTISDVELIVGGLAAIAVLAELAHALRVPYPVVLVLGGLALGLTPGVPVPTLDPRIFFFLFLPPLLYSEAFLYSTEELKSAAAEIFTLAVGLVVATAVGVAVVAHAVAGLSWPAAFVLGAVVGPTDPVSATSVVRRLGVSDRIATILEGESLVNDGTALVAYKLAVAAAAAGTFSLGHAVAELARVSVAGVLIGAVVAWVASVARRFVRVMEAEITLSLMMPFAAYLPAERLGVSGVLAAVTAGLLMGRRAHATSGGTRLRRYAFWEILAFLLNSTLFLLVGLAFRDILDKLGGVTAVDLLGQALIIALTVVALRVAWMLLVPRAIAVLAPRRSRPLPSADVVVLGWSGMRGGVSVAAALSVPVAAAGEPFPGRPQIIFFAYVVVLTTLVVPGLTLGPLVGRLGLGREGQRSRSDARARRHILDAALEHIQELADSGELPEEISDRLRELYVSRIDGVPVPDGLTPVDEIGADSAAALSARRGAIAAQRAALAGLETDDRIDAATAREMRRELDLEEQACI